MVPPEALVWKLQVKPVPVPPDGENALVPRGVTVALDGVTLTPAVTVMFAVAKLPSESVTFTTSVALPVRPAVYTPLTSVPPEAFEVNTQAKPTPLPPDAAKVRVPPGGREPLGGERDRPAVTVMERVAVLP